MPQSSLEKRVSQLESQVMELMAHRIPDGARKDWRQTIGAFTGDEVMKEIINEGRKIREKERKAAKSRPKKNRTSRE